MYADRVEAETNRSIKDRLEATNSRPSTRRRFISGKRQREDGKWKHNLFEHSKLHVSDRRIGKKDLRLKLQRKSIMQAVQSVKRSFPGGIGDLREKLSGVVSSQPVDTELPKKKQKPVSEVNEPTTENVIAEAPVSETKKAASSVTKKKTQQKAESVDSFLKLLGLEKYSITFLAEEVDMDALIHMTDNDLKAVGIPMGPRKKILHALGSKV